MASAANKFADSGFLIDIFLAGGQKALDARSEVAPSRFARRVDSSLQRRRKFLQDGGG
jgi:hypothetical protein